jgi:hypothetical protein
MSPADKPFLPAGPHDQRRRSTQDEDAALASKICIPNSLPAAEALDQLERAGYIVREYDGYLVLDRHEVWHFRTDIALLAFTAGVLAQRQRCSRRARPYTKVTYEL